MLKKTYHQRGRKPRRKVITSVDGRIYSEHVKTIVELYVLDRMSVEDIARLYGTGNSKGVGKICRRGARFLEGLCDEKNNRYFKRAARYAQVLNTLAAKPDWTYRRIARFTGLRRQQVAEIARRNGQNWLGREDG